MDDKWEHASSDTIRVSIQSKERVRSFSDLPYPVQREFRWLSYPPDPNSVPAGTFDNVFCWVRSDGVTTYIADSHNDKSVSFCDFQNEEVVAHAQTESSSLTKIFVHPENRHHYEAAHLLISINEFLQENGKRLDSGTLTETVKKDGWRAPESYKVARAVWGALVTAGLVEPVPQKDGNGVPNRFQFIERKTL